MAGLSRVALDGVDAGIGVTAAGLAGLARCGRAAGRLADSPARTAVRAGHAAARLAPGPAELLRHRACAARDGGRTLRFAASHDLGTWVGAWLPGLVEGVLARLDLTELVVRHVDLDRVAAGLDVDAVLDRIDLTDVVVRRVDLDRVARELDVDAVVARADLDAAVGRVDLVAVVDAVLDRIDLTEIVVRRVDLDRVARGLDIDAVIARADLDATIARLDLVALADFVVDGIDLPKIIRESTGSVASEGLREVRLQSFEADQALARFVGRVLARRSDRGVPPRDRADGGSRAGGS
jgi:hypothetical protein